MNKKSKMKDTLIYLAQLGIMIVVTYIVFTFVVRPIRIIGPSMTPTVQDQDFAMTNVIGLKMSGVQRFDVVVIDCEALNENIIKRVIGLPGETVEYRNDQLYINGAAMDESFFDRDYIEQAKRTEGKSLFTDDFTYTVPEGEYFVLGDNRLHSQDSRTLGTFKINDMIGKNGVTVFPFNHFSWIN